MRNKEEIMDDILSRKPSYCEIEREEVLECMDEYAKELAIDFLEWKDMNYVPHIDYWYGVYYHKNDLLKHISEGTFYTTEQLFEKYLSEKQNIK